MIRYIGMGNMYSALLFSLPPREGFTTHDHLLVSRGDAAGPNGTSECVERLLGRIDAPGSKGGIKATRQQSCVVRSSCSVACWKFSTRTCAYLFLLVYRGLTCSRCALCSMRTHVLISRFERMVDIGLGSDHHDEEYFTDFMEKEKRFSADVVLPILKSLVLSSTMLGESEIWVSS